MGVRRRVGAPVLVLGLAVLFAACGRDASVGRESAPTPTTSAIGPNGNLEAIVADRPSGEPGCVVGISTEGGVETATFGLADVESKVAIDDSTIFDLASVSKQFTGAAMMNLVSEGELSLSDLVSDHVPVMEAYPHDVRIEDLLHHTSGVAEYFDALIEQGREAEVVTQAETVELIPELEPEGSPGVEVSYVNSNYVLLAEVVEEVTGQAFPKVLEETLFKPAGLESAFVHDYQLEVPGLATSYDEDGEPEHSSWAQYGDGAVHMTLSDLLRWGKYLTEDESDLLDAMVDGAEELEDGGAYGAGLIVEEVDGERRLHHSGAWLGFENEFVILPEAGVTAAVLCNHTGSDSEELIEEVVARAKLTT